MTILKAVLFAVAMFVILAPSEASAWYCRATSPSAYGWGQSDSRSYAQRRALAECAARTPRGQVCRIRYCR